MTDDRVTLNFQVHLARPSKRLVVRDGPAPTPAAPSRRLAKATRRLVQAHALQRMLDRGEAHDLADLARRAGLTRARVTQIVSLTLLAPDIQAAILALPLVAPGREPVPERLLRTLVRTPIWAEQRATWHAARGNLSDADTPAHQTVHRRNALCDPTPVRPRPVEVTGASPS